MSVMLPEGTGGPAVPPPATPPAMPPPGLPPATPPAPPPPGLPPPATPPAPPPPAPPPAELPPPSKLWLVVYSTKPGPGTPHTPRQHSSAAAHTEQALPPRPQALELWPSRHSSRPTQQPAQVAASQTPPPPHWHPPRPRATTRRKKSGKRLRTKAKPYPGNDEARRSSRGVRRATTTSDGGSRLTSWLPWCSCQRGAWCLRRAPSCRRRLPSSRRGWCSRRAGSWCAPCGPREPRRRPRRPASA